MPAGESRSGYFDTSVLVKCYVEEAGSAAAIATLARHIVVSSAIAPVELASALRRRRAHGDLTAAGLAAIEARVRRERSQWMLRALDELVLDRAERVGRSVPVRTLDALHLASALVFREESGYDAPLITAYARQRGAAVALGLSVTFLE
jgi:predicted nucleic acid-binding protein